MLDWTVNSGSPSVFDTDPFLCEVSLSKRRTWWTLITFWVDRPSNWRIPVLGYPFVVFVFISLNKCARDRVCCWFPSFQGCVLVWCGCNFFVSSEKLLCIQRVFDFILFLCRTVCSRFVKWTIFVAVFWWPMWTLVFFSFLRQILTLGMLSKKLNWILIQIVLDAFQMSPEVRQLKWERKRSLVKARFRG
jgi:hypothetical protein